MLRPFVVLAFLLPASTGCYVGAMEDGIEQGADPGAGEPVPEAPGGDADDGDSSDDPDAEDGDPSEEAGTITFGNVPKPDMMKRHLNGANHPMMGYSNQQIVIEGVVWHRMVGSLWGTDDWFFAGKAATAYGIGVADMDGAAAAGTIIEWIDPANGHWYGHSSGPVSSPYGDGA